MAKGKPTKYDSLVKLGPGGDPCWTGEGLFDTDALAMPLRWRAPRKIFVDSMSDLFFDAFTNEQIAAVFGVMAACPQHTFQVLTKRPKRMREWFAWANPTGRALLARPALPPRELIENAALYALDGVVDSIPSRGLDNGWPLPNVWLGVSVENQDAAEERIPDLLATPAAVRFLSCEPLLGEVDLDLPRCDDRNHGPAEWCVADDGATPWCVECDAERSYGHWLHPDGIGWVIVGCESGAAARPLDSLWVRWLRNQCKHTGTAFFLKQMTEEGSRSDDSGGLCTVLVGSGSKRKPGGVVEMPYLDGVQHLEFPEVEA
jgi:protein gp37